MKTRDHFGIGRWRVVGLTQDADARALSPSRSSDCRVVAARLLAARARDGVVWVLAGDHLEDATASATVRAIGPAMSASRLSGTTPARLVSPIVERMPTSAWCDDGPRMELPVSVPSPTSPKLAATAAAVPPLEPAVTRSSAYGFFV